YRTCLGLLNLAKTYSSERLERACLRARIAHALTYKNIASMLSKGLDKAPLPESDTQNDLPFNHEHVRGADYYQ
ncbi:MAG: IS21 family transposase, partial [Enterovibrio sp.]